MNLRQEPGRDSTRPRAGGAGRIATAAAVVVVVAALAASPWLRRSVDAAQPTAPAAAAAAVAGTRVTVTPATFDLGDVFMDVSEVPMEFSVVNQGERVAVVTYIETSCDCTSAALVMDGKEGPRFAMSHATPPGAVDWRAVLAPGEAATLMVYYNPQAHGVATPAEAPGIHGPATRLVRLHADDATRPYAVDLRIDLNQRH